jgi:hypothetical protein
VDTAALPRGTAPAGSPASTAPRPETGRAARGTGAAAPTRPAASSGTIVVRSSPSGAGVTLNGRWRGRTPLTLDDLPFARYEVRVVQPGYTPVQEAVRLSSAAPERSLSVSLEAQARPAARTATPGGRRSAPARTAGGAESQAFTGSVYVDSRPRGARVFIDGKAVGVTPLSVPEIRIGSHVVRLELPDHRIWSSATRVVSGQTSRVTGSLERIQ